MRLAEFIDHARLEIIAESIAYAARIPALQSASPEILRDHLPLVLDAIVSDLKQTQSRMQSINKSQGKAPPAVAETAEQTHGQLRARSGLDIEQLVAEYRVLRSCVLRVWAETYPPDGNVIADTLRFNEAVDQAVAESVNFHHTETIRWRNIFLAVLGHDLRNPLNAMLLTAELAACKVSGAAAGHIDAVLQFGRRMAGLLDSLLKYSKPELGIAIPIHRKNVNLGLACEKEVTMLRSAFPRTEIVFSLTGETQGSFDSSRVREALGNLISNAAQHSPEGTMVKVAVVGTEAAVEISTENIAEPTSAEALETMFEPLRRHSGRAGALTKNLGLGLFVVREIARAHQGEVAALSVENRLQFKISLPKVPQTPGSETRFETRPTGV